MKRKKDAKKLPGTSVYLIYLIAEQLLALYIQGRMYYPPVLLSDIDSSYQNFSQ